MTIVPAVDRSTSIFRRICRIEFPDTTRCNFGFEVATILKVVAAETQPYEFPVIGEQTAPLDQNCFVYPTPVENACWESFIRVAFDADNAAEWDVEFVPIKDRCEHLIL